MNSIKLGYSYTAKMLADDPGIIAKLEARAQAIASEVGGVSVKHRREWIDEAGNHRVSLSFAKAEN